MKRPISLPIVLFTSFIVSAEGFAEERLLRYAQGLASASIGEAAGQYFNPKVSPHDKNWISYEVSDQIGNQSLYLLNLRNGVRIELNLEKRKSQDTLRVDPFAKRRAATSYAGELVWCPALLRGGQWFVFVGTTGGNQDLYVGNLTNTAKLFRLTHDGAVDDQPVWSPDGTKLAFTSRRSGGADIYLFRDMHAILDRLEINATGAAEEFDGGKLLSRLTDNPREELYPAWSPDGSSIACTKLGFAGDPFTSEIVAVNVKTAALQTLAVGESRVLRNISFSPVGNLAAYYAAAGKKVDETVDLVVASVEYRTGTLAALNTKWKPTERLQDVKARLQGGPRWSNEGSLFFLNDKTGKRNAVYEISKDALQRTSPSITTAYLYFDEGAVEYNLNGFDFLREGGRKYVILSGQKGDSFGLYYERGFVPDEEGIPSDSSVTRMKNLIGVSGGLTYYPGFLPREKAKVGFTAELCWLMLNRNHFFLKLSLGYDEVKGGDDPNFYFKETGIGLKFSPGYEFAKSERFSLMGVANVGLLAFSEDETTQPRSKNLIGDGIKLSFGGGLAMLATMPNSTAITGEAVFLKMPENLNGYIRFVFGVAKFL